MLNPLTQIRAVLVKDSVTGNIEIDYVSHIYIHKERDYLASTSYDEFPEDLMAAWRKQGFTDSLFEDILTGATTFTFTVPARLLFTAPEFDDLTLHRTMRQEN